MTATAPTAATESKETPKTPPKAAPKAAPKAGANGKAPKAAPKKAPKKVDEFAVSHIEYLSFTPVLDTTDKGTVRKDKGGGKTAGAARTDRFVAARLYRTGADKCTIQTTTGEEIILKISAMERILGRCKELSITGEIPAF